MLGAVGQTGRAMRLPGVDGYAPIIIAPVMVGDSVPAFLLTLDDGELPDGDDLRLLLTEHAATICGVVLGRERVVSAAAGQVRYDLVEGLLSGRSEDVTELGRWAEHLGYDEDADHRVLSLVVEGGSAASGLVAQIAEIVERFFNRQVPEAITAVRGSEVVVVLPELEDESARAHRLARACIARVRERSGQVSVMAGIGGVCRSAVEVAGSYDDARRTVEILARLDRPGAVVAIEELGIHRLLLRVADPEQLRAFAREVLGGFMTRTKGNAGEYLATVACYFRESHSPQRASSVLHVHPNTVAYRVRRVEELSNLDFGNYRDRLMAQVALEIIEMVGDTA
ncbi:PucR family transcriptional regulator [Nocardia sp. NPDC059246]|uniref:PucR family transcriptional regulator n=1 Tax=unclassified Nocardia TaxID=2637762 RepID=UPI003699A40E